MLKLKLKNQLIIQQTCVKGAKLLQYVTLLQFFMFKKKKLMDDWGYFWAKIKSFDWIKKNNKSNNNKSINNDDNNS